MEFSLITLGVQNGTGIANAFDNSIMPIFYEIGTVLFKCCIVYGVYYIIRMQYTQGVERIKWAVIGYISLRLTDSFIQLIDNIAKNMKF